MIAKVKGKGKVSEAAAAAAAADARARTELRRPRGPPGPRPASSPTAAPSRSSGPGEADLQSALRENQALRDSVGLPFSSVRAAVSEWELLTEDKAIIKVIKHGVDIPLVQIPQPLDLPPWSEEVCSQVLRGLPATTERDRVELSILRVDVQIPPYVSLKQQIFNCRQCRPQQHIAGSARARKAVYSGTGQLEGSILKLQSFHTLLGRVWTHRDASWHTAQHSRASFLIFTSFHRLLHLFDTLPTRCANFPTRL